MLTQTYSRWDKIVQPNSSPKALEPSSPTSKGWSLSIGNVQGKNSYHCLKAWQCQRDWDKSSSVQQTSLFGGLRVSEIGQWAPPGALRTQDLMNSSPGGRGFFTPGLLQQRHCYMIKNIPQRKPLQTACCIPRKTLPREADKIGKMNQTYRQHSILISEWEVPDTMTTSPEK